MTDIDRRTVFGIAGAGLALAACSKADSNAAGAAAVNGATAGATGDSANFLGACLLHGVAANTPKSGTFDPAYICAVYIRLNGGGTFTIRHSYEPAGKDTTKHDEIAVTMLTAARAAASDTNWKGPANNIPKRKEIGFDNFTFGSRQLIYFFIDNDPGILRFDERNKDDTILRFSPYSGKNYAAGAVMKENHAFYNLKLKDLKIQGSKSQRAVVVEFWNTDKTGNEIKPDPADSKTHYVYSLNLHVLMNAGKRNGDANDRDVPVILDPDTGNVGNGP